MDIFVIPANAGTQWLIERPTLGPRLRGDDRPSR